MGAVRARDTQVDQWLPDDAQRVYVILNNLSAHRGPRMCCCLRWRTRAGVRFQPTYAAYLNLIELWWKVLRTSATPPTSSSQRCRPPAPSSINLADEPLNWPTKNSGLISLTRLNAASVGPSKENARGKSTFEIAGDV